MVPKFDGVADEDGPGLLSENAIAAIVVDGRTQVETLLSPIVPRATEGGFAVVENPAAGRAHRCGIKVVGTKEAFPGGRQRSKSMIGPEQI